MRIEELLIEKKFIIETNEPYILALDTIQFIKGYKITERVNKYETDGPVKKTEIIFNLVKQLNTFSQIILNLTMRGESNHTGYLHIDVSGKMITQIENCGFMIDVFKDFYLKTIFPNMLRSARQELNELEIILEKEITKKIQLKKH